MILNLSVLGWVSSKTDSDTRIQEQHLCWKVTLGREWSQGSRSWLWVGGLSPAPEPVGQCGPSLRALLPQDWCGRHIDHQPPLLICQWWLLSGCWSPSLYRLPILDQADALGPHGPGQVESQTCLWWGESKGRQAKQFSKMVPVLCLFLFFTLVLQGIIITLVLHSSFRLTKNYHKPDVFTLERSYFSLQTIFVSLSVSLSLFFFFTVFCWFISYIQSNWI